MSGFIGLAVVAALIGAVWFGIRSFKRKLAASAGEMLQLVQQGATTTAKIVVTEKRRMSRAQFEYFVTYAFNDRADAEHRKEFRVPATTFDEYREGADIDIVYVPGNPSISATREMVDRVRNAPAGPVPPV